MKNKIVSIGLIIFIIISIFYYYNSKIDKEILRVEILNGTKVSGLASKMAKCLRNKKIDVIIVSNAKYDTISQTIFIDRMRRDARYAKYVAKQLKCSNIMSDTNSTLYIDVTVIIGNDYKKFLHEE